MYLIVEAFPAYLYKAHFKDPSTFAQVFHMPHQGILCPEKSVDLLSKWPCKQLSYK